MESLGIETQTEYYDPTTLDYTGLLSRVKGFEPDLLVYGYLIDPALTILKQALEVDAAPRYYGYGARIDDGLERAIGGPVQVPWMVLEYPRSLLYPNDPGLAALVPLAEEKLGHSPLVAGDSYVLYHYHYLPILVQAMQAAGTVDDTAAIAAALGSGSFDVGGVGVSGPLQFEEHAPQLPRPTAASSSLTAASSAAPSRSRLRAGASSDFDRIAAVRTTSQIVPGWDPPGDDLPAEALRPLGIREVVDAIDEVADPCSASMGRPIGLAEMAILRKVEVMGRSVSVGLCLTEPTCLYAFQIAESVQEHLHEVFGDDVEVKLEVPARGRRGVVDRGPPLAGGEGAPGRGPPLGPPGRLPTPGGSDRSVAADRSDHLNTAPPSIT